MQVVLGGVLLGLAAGLMLLLRGKVLGCSGILFRTWDLTTHTLNMENLLFLAGLFLSGLLFNYYQNIPNPTSLFKTNYWLMVLGGVLVGSGTFLSNGCTSGHGLCGLSLWRKRSIIAVCVFFPVAIIISHLVH